MSLRFFREHLRACSGRSAVRVLRSVLGALALVIALDFPQIAAAQETTVTRRVLLFTGVGFGGSGDVTANGGTSLGDFDLGSSPLVGGRFEWVFLRYLGFGGQLETTFWRGEGGGRRNPMIDLSITPRVRYPIIFDSRFLIEPYLVIPVGFSLGIWNSSFDAGSLGLDRANPGLNVGALLGATFLTRSHVGAMIEFGWVHHVIYDSPGDARWTLTLNQATLRAGVVYAY